VEAALRLARVLDGEMSRRQLQRAWGLKNSEHFRKAYLQPALEGGLIEMTVPDKPRSTKQKYRLTPKGLAAVAPKLPKAGKDSRRTRPKTRPAARKKIRNRSTGRCLISTATPRPRSRLQRLALPPDTEDRFELLLRTDVLAKGTNLQQWS
jgi:ATP-dependent DNA helicase RecG